MPPRPCLSCGKPLDTQGNCSTEFCMYNPHTELDEFGVEQGEDGWLEPDVDESQEITEDLPEDYEGKFDYDPQDQRERPDDGRDKEFEPDEDGPDEGLDQQPDKDGNEKGESEDQSQDGEDSDDSQQGQGEGDGDTEDEDGEDTTDDPQDADDDGQDGNEGNEQEEDEEGDEDEEEDDTCPTCNGNCDGDGPPCPDCDGTGKKPKDEEGGEDEEEDGDDDDDGEEDEEDSEDDSDEEEEDEQDEDDDEDQDEDRIVCHDMNGKEVRVGQCLRVESNRDNVFAQDQILVAGYGHCKNAVHKSLERELPFLMHDAGPEWSYKPSWVWQDNPVFTIGGPDWIAQGCVLIEDERNKRDKEDDKRDHDEERRTVGLTKTQFERFVNITDRIFQKVGQTFGKTSEDERIREVMRDVIEKGDASREMEIVSRGVVYKVSIYAQKED